MTRKQEIQKILNLSKKINPNEVSDSQGNLDFEKLKENTITKEQIRELKNIGVSAEELRGNGFILGAMVLGRYLE